jgi:molecular chaperone GrpE
MDTTSKDEEPQAPAETSEPAAPEPEAQAAAAPAADAPVVDAAPQQPEPEAEQADPLEAAKQDVERYRNQMLRVAADFDNFRKRSRREIEDASRRSREELLRELLPVFDNLERAVSHSEQVPEARAVSDGVKMVLRLFHDTIGKLGVSRVKTLGEPFDPNVHEAIQQLASADHAPGTVMAEVLPGYAWDDRLVRAAMVVVAKAPPDPAPPPEPPAEPAPEPGSSSEQ